MEWFETENVAFISATAAKFASKELSKLEEAQREGHEIEYLWNDVLAKGRELGFFLCSLPEEKGGIGLDVLSQAMLIAELAKGNPGYALFAATQNICIESLTRFGGGKADGVIEEFIEKPDSSWFGLGIEESIFEKAEKKSFLACPVLGKAMHVLLVDSEKGLVSPAEYPNATLLKFSGLTEMGVSRIYRAEGESISDEKPKEITQLIQSRWKLFLSAALYGNAVQAQKAAVQYGQERIQTGRKIIDHQNVRKVLVRNEMMLVALESYLTRMANFDGNPRQKGINVYDMLYRFACETGEKVCLDAIQTLGGYGYMKDYGLEKRLRDCKAMAVISGSYLPDVLGGC